MKLYVELSAYNYRFNQVTGNLYFYILEVKQWVEMGNIGKDENGHFLTVWA